MCFPAKERPFLDVFDSENDDEAEKITNLKIYMRM